MRTFNAQPKPMQPRTLTLSMRPIPMLAQMCQICLLVVLACTVHANVPGNAAAQSTTATMRSVSMDADHLALTSTYRRHTQQNDAAMSVTTEQLWGVQMASQLPMAGLHARVDYAMTATDRLDPNAAVADTVSPGFSSGNHLLQVRLESQWQNLRYGMRYFSAGQDLDSAALGRSLLHQADAIAAADGTELWANLRMAGFEVRPSYRRRNLAATPGQDRVDETLTVRAHHAMFQATHLDYEYQSHQCLTAVGDTESAFVNELNRQTRVGLRHPRWGLNWARMSSTSEQSGLRTEVQTQQLAGSIALYDALRLSPSLTREVAYMGPLAAQFDTTATLDFSFRRTADADSELNLRLRYRERSGFEENSLSTAAELGWHRTLRLPGVERARTKLSAALALRQERDTTRRHKAQQLSVTLTLEHKVG